MNLYRFNQSYISIYTQAWLKCRFKITTIALKSSMLTSPSTSLCSITLPILLIYQTHSELNKMTDYSMQTDSIYYLGGQTNQRLIREEKDTMKRQKENSPPRLLKVSNVRVEFHAKFTFLQASFSTQSGPCLFRVHRQTIVVNAETGSSHPHIF